MNIHYRRVGIPGQSVILMNIHEIKSQILIHGYEMVRFIHIFHGPLSLTWFNFNPTMEK